MRVTVAHPDCALQFSGRGVPWVYADERLSRYESIVGSLGEQYRFIQAKDFQKAAARLQPYFVKWSDEQVCHEDIADVLLTPLHRNPFGNNLLLYLTWLTLIADRRDRAETELLIFTESIALARTIEKFCKTMVWEMRLLGRWRMSVGWARGRVRACIKLGYDLLSVLLRMLLSRQVFRSNHLARCAKVDILIDAYFYADSLAANGEYHDKHLPGLVSWYQDHGFSPAVYPYFIRITLSNLPELYKRMRDSSTLFVPWERFITLGHVLKTAVRCLAYGLKSNAGRLIYREVDVTPLVSSLRFDAATAGMNAMLLERSPQGLYSHGIRPKYYLDWFENQPIDKACAIGFTAGQPDCKIFGLRQYALSPNFASLYTTDSEVSYGNCPQESWVVGSEAMEKLSQYDHVSKYRIVPALRYASLYERTNQYGNQNDLVIVLTHSREETTAILAMVFPVLECIAELFGVVRIKPHTDYPVSSFIKALSQRFPRVVSASWLVWESRAMNLVLSDARIAITSGSSSALEALCCGVPVILAGRNAGLDINPLADLDERVWKIAYRPDDVKRAMIEWSPSHPLSSEMLLAIGYDIRSRFFEPVNEETMRAYIPS